MILRTKNLSIREITEEDINGVIEVYNSNQDFLKFHIGRQEVNIEWLIQEQKEMKAIDFKILVAKENESNVVIGFIDIGLMEECYLSLLMVHNEFRCKGYGKEIYDALEDCLRENNFRRIRIDVAYGYSEEVLQFWKNRGFEEIKKIKLQWVDRLFDAIVMKKDLN
ncbi:GNAT family N-acetyltransferase [Tissierella carlieri]|uniref:GNAT family N-acetyltransferase n=1 Tax=Tissierella carlieri TaxID=689904 RepID=A0ABT1SAW3_9FIRM|nr:GNAT family N-acetyltransferase [Tissierella carlieri]MCQ4923614.1 GNAT family N-acetyltransferase [Tissierella carlieri]